MDSQSSARAALRALILLALVLVALAMHPFFEALFLAAVLAGALFPLQRWLTGKLWDRRALAASLICLGVLAAVLAPCVGFGIAVMRDIMGLADSMIGAVQQEGLIGAIDRLPPSIANAIHYVIDRSPWEEDRVLQEIQGALTRQGSKLARLATDVLAGTGGLMVDAGMVMVVLFFLLTDGPRLVAWLERVSPLQAGQTAELLREFRSVSASVLSSSLATALVQTAVALPGYLIAGVPKPWLFTLATFFLAFIPTVGAGGTCIGAAALLLVLGKPMALLIAVWGVVLVGLSDNLLKPLLVRRGAHMHGAVVFVALVSGLTAFGPIGLLLGPLAISFLLALIRIYRRDFGLSTAPPAS